VLSEKNGTLKEVKGGERRRKKVKMEVYELLKEM